MMYGTQHQHLRVCAKGLAVLGCASAVCMAPHPLLLPLCIALITNLSNARPHWCCNVCVPCHAVLCSHSGLFILNAHHVSETSGEGFAVRLYRQGPTPGFDPSGPGGNTQVRQRQGEGETCACLRVGCVEWLPCGCCFFVPLRLRASDLMCTRLLGILFSALCVCSAWWLTAARTCCHLINLS